MIKQKLSMTIGVFVLAGLAAVGLFQFWPRQVQAFNPQPDPPGFGMVGLVQNQVMRINVVNTNVPDPNLPPDPVKARVVIAFRDADGNLIRNAEGGILRRAAQIGAGESISLDLNSNLVLRSADAFGRVQIRPDVRIQRPDGVNGLPPDPVIPSVEIFNLTNGRTQLMISPVTVTAQTATPTT